MAVWGMTARTIGIVLFAVAAVAVTRPADACSYYYDDPTFVQLEAPPGGIWWLTGSTTGEHVALVNEDGDNVVAEVAHPGLLRTVVVRVPDDAVPGEQFLLPDFATGEFASANPRLVVSGGSVPDVNRSVPPPDAVVEMRDTRVGYVGAFTLPDMGTCSQAAGLWTHHYSDRPWLVANVPDGHVIDVTVRLEGEPAFTDFPHANAVIFEAHEPGAIDEPLPLPPEGNLSFVVHARLRRVADAEVGPTVSLPVVVPEGSEERLEWVGCSSSSLRPTSPTFLMLLTGFFLLWRRRNDGCGGRLV